LAKDGPIVSDAGSSPFVGNVIAPRPDACFRLVADEPHGGYPVRCPEPVAFRSEW
jgi:hypothetical protein